jgi:hypothetical protein
MLFNRTTRETAMASTYNDGQREIAHWQDVPAKIRADVRRELAKLGADDYDGELSLYALRELFTMAAAGISVRLEKRITRAMAKHHPELDVLD